MEYFDAREDVWIIIPAYNENTVVGDVVKSLVASFPNVVVVDDGSSDCTGAVASENGATVLRHIVNRGQGAALQTGLDFALAQGADFIVTFDSDGQHCPEDLYVMLSSLDEAGADVALGSRFLGSAPGMTGSKRLLLRAAILFQRLTSGVRLTDAHNGLRLFTRQAAERIHLRHDRMAHASEIVTQIGSLGLNVIEVPCTIRYTAYSVGKGQKLPESLRILLDIVLMGLHK